MHKILAGLLFVALFAGEAYAQKAELGSDYNFPAMDARYRPSDEVINQVTSGLHKYMFVGICASNFGTHSQVFDAMQMLFESGFKNIGLVIFSEEYCSLEEILIVYSKHDEDGSKATVGTSELSLYSNSVELAKFIAAIAEGHFLSPQLNRYTDELVQAIKLLDLDLLLSKAQIGERTYKVSEFNREMTEYCDLLTVGRSECIDELHLVDGRNHSVRQALDRIKARIAQLDISLKNLKQELDEFPELPN